MYPSDTQCTLDLSLPAIILGLPCLVNPRAKAQQAYGVSSCICLFSISAHTLSESSAVCRGFALWAVALSATGRSFSMTFISAISAFSISARTRDISLRAAASGQKLTFVYLLRYVVTKLYGQVLTHWAMALFVSGHVRLFALSHACADSAPKARLSSPTCQDVCG